MPYPLWPKSGHGSAVSLQLIEGRETALPCPPLLMLQFPTTHHQPSQCSDKFGKESSTCGGKFSDVSANEHPHRQRPTPIRTFGEYEQKFLQLLEGVAQGWSRGEIKGFLIACKINDAEWENWLQEFGERLLVSPETNLELGGRMVRLGKMNCGKISEVAGNIGRQLLAGESLSRNPADDSSVGNENIVTPLLARER